MTDRNELISEPESEAPEATTETTTEANGSVETATIEREEETASAATIEPPVDFGPVPDPPQPGPANPSPDGTRLAYLQPDDTGRLRLWLAPLDGNPPTAVDLSFEPVLDEDGPQWSPDGARLALTGRHPSADRTAIWLYEIESGQSSLLADHAGADRSPRWSPDGSWVAFVSRRAGRDAICVVTVDGSSLVVQLTHAPAGQDDRDPCWSPDGTRIAFCRRSWEGEQTGDHIWTIDVTNGETKQVTKKLSPRHSLRWAPHRPQIAYINQDSEWDNIAVVNPDNSAGWNLSSERGDKADPRYSRDGSRMLYSRLNQGVVRILDRGVSAATADPYDPGNGVADAGRWLGDDETKRVVYRYAPATGAPRFIVQEAAKDAERQELPPAVPWEAGRDLVEPTHLEFDTWNATKLGALYYRQPQWVGRLPAVIYLDEAPHRPRTMSFRPVEQSLAAAGFAVVAPSLHGTPGYGRKIFNALREHGEMETEANDLLDLIKMLRARDDIDGDRIAIVGWGHGGSIALTFAGGRPGYVKAAVAIDPIVDWDLELDEADDDYREWHAQALGLPISSQAQHALRAPETFVGAISVPLLLIGTDRAGEGRQAQLEVLVRLLDELGGVQFERETSAGETRWTTAARAAAFVRKVLGPNPAPPAEAMRTETL